MKWAVISALAFALLGVFALMGLPGAALLELWQALVRPFGITLKCMQKDAAWPSALYCTVLFAVFIPISYYLVFRKLKLQGKQRLITMAAALLLSSAFITLLLECLANSGT